MKVLFCVFCLDDLVTQVKANKVHIAIFFFRGTFHSITSFIFIVNVVFFFLRSNLNPVSTLMHHHMLILFHRQLFAKCVLFACVTAVAKQRAILICIRPFMIKFVIELLPRET